jgi:hypothetical protein
MVFEPSFTRRRTPGLHAGCAGKRPVNRPDISIESLVYIDPAGHAIS